MSSIIPLNLPKTSLQLSRKDEEIYVQCLIRRKKIKLTPEEWVRQHFIAYLHQEHHFPLSRIAVEKSIQYAGLTKRWDIVVYDPDFLPFVLVECKAPHVPISMDTLYQALTYQKEMQGKFIALSNGLTHAFYEVDVENKRLTVLEKLPIDSSSII
ncbi:MAG: hypothetical protein RLZZ585_2001 [Bacteroidota bacterium]|jgi:hypothetical protein